MLSNKKEIIYRDYKNENLKKYYANKNTQTTRLFNWLYVLIASMICFRALYVYYKIRNLYSILPIQSFFIIILAIIFITAADEAATKSDTISIFTPSLLWVGLLVFFYTKFTKPVEITAIMLIAIITFIYFTLNSSISPFYPLLRFKLKFVFSFIEALIVTILLSLVFVGVIGIFSYFQIFNT